jgi:hypothetical protein
MSVGRLRGMLGLAAAVVAVACGDGGTNPNTRSATPSVLSIISGDGQTGLVGTTLSIPLTVRVLSASNTSVANATVNFAVTQGAATVSPASVVTDTSGMASTVVTLGSTAGDVKITATVQGTTVTTTFSASAGTGAIQTACTGSSPQAPAAGGVIPSVPGTGICLSGGANGADYAIVAFNSNPDSELVAAGFAIKGSGITTLTTANVVPTSGVSASRAPSTTAPLFSRVAARRGDIRTAFDLHLRETARRELTRLIPDARRAYAASRSSSSARFDVIPTGTPAVGTVWRLNANGNDACDNATMVGARVVAVSNTAIIVADTLNPTANGFTTADYNSFAQRFDTLVNPLDVNAFGSPTDIDKNGHIVIFITKEVNKLTPRGSNGFIGGFFFERDLFPTTDNQTLGLQGCAGSNFGEIFYVLAPDSLAQFGDQRKKSDVVSNTTGTLAHEYQHLINAGRRLYVNNAEFFETVWMNEGLSHIAEELLYYRVSGKAPRQNIGISELAASSQTISDFNEFQSDNLGRFEVFIEKPTLTNVHADNDSLETRGATWDLLRYLADHRGASDGDVWQQLVNTSLTGLDNLAHVFGSDYMTSIQNWSTSVFSDDVAGVTDTRFLEPSWNMRSIFPQLCTDERSPCTRLGVYPLQITSLINNQTSNQSIVAGGSSYIRFSVPAGSQASIDWSNGGFPVTPFVQFTVVRTR